jgi:hypothetical protein
VSAGHEKDLEIPVSDPLKPGDRVRVTVRNRMPGYQPGDKGTVMRETEVGPNRQRYYTVAMDKDDPSQSWAVFTEDEIELDV